MNLLDLTDAEIRVLGFMHRGGHLRHFTRYDGIELFGIDDKPTSDVICTNPVFLDLRDHGFIEIKGRLTPKKPNSLIIYRISERGRYVIHQKII